MAEPFKNLFNPTMIGQMGDHIASHYAEFDRTEFLQLACEGLDELELKARSNQIRDALITTLPNNFNQLSEVLVAALHPENNVPLKAIKMDDQGIRGWAIMPMADVIAMLGIEHFDTSMQALAEMTCRLTAEFAIRPFFIANPQRAIEWAMRWADDDNEHIRRLASEGSRTRLPWGLRLQCFVENPLPLMPLLEKLRDDPSEYVRRSVANNINDIAKDHPERVAKLAEDWLKGASKEREQLVKHACRGLIKQGHPETLAALGYGPAEVEITSFTLANNRLKVGESLQVSVGIKSTAKTDQPLIIDYAIHHQKANGTTSPMVFKWKIAELKPDKTLNAKKQHSFKPVTTRKYYAGAHKIELLINGESKASTAFELVLT